MKDENLPIGYWLKTVDNLLTKGIDEIQSGFEFSREDWQLLNLMAKHSEIAIIDARKTMRPFLKADNLDTCVNKLYGRQLIIVSKNKIKITQTGISQHKKCLEKQMVFRKKVMQDISPEDYKTTVETLLQMSKNITLKKKK